MRLWINLCEAAGFGQRALQLGQLVLAASFLIGSLVWVATSVAGLGIALATLTLGGSLELIRMLGQRRQKILDSSWPAVFDLLRSGTQAGLSNQEQFRYLAASGPKSLRPTFRQLAIDTEHGLPLDRSLARFQSLVGSRSGDVLALVLLISMELGGRGLSDVWEQSAKEVRSELQLLGDVQAKQSWVLASAKLALLAPWLVAFLLLGPTGNRVAFASQGGTTVLLIGLIMSAAAYFLTNLLGRLKLPGRLFNVA